MKRFEKSRILKDKKHLWEAAEDLQNMLNPEMEAIYGTANVSKKALAIIDYALAEYVLANENRLALRSYLLTSFMAKNGAKDKPKRPKMGSALNGIYERLSQIEARLGIVPE